MAAALLSRVTGLGREVLAAALFGVGSQMSAFTVALQIPGIIRASVADIALASSVVPAFTDLLGRDEEERGWRVASTIVSLILLVMLPLTLLAMWEAPRIIDVVVHQQFGQQGLASALFRIMIPIVVLMSVAGVVSAILNAFGHFSTPALAPVASNVLVIVALYFGIQYVDPAHRIYVYAFAFVAGTALQFLMPLPWLRHRGGRLRLHLDMRDPYVKAILLMMLPVSLSLFLLEITPVINTYFSTGIPLVMLKKDTGPAVLDKALRIFQAAQGIVSLTMAAVFFPLFARCRARNDMEGFRAAFADGMRQLFILLLPAAALMVLLAEPMVRVLYERRAWDPSQTPVVASALRGFALGLASNGGFLLLMRAFFSLNKPWVPAIAGIVNCFANVCFAMLLQHRGVWGLAVSTGLANTIACALMYLMLHRRVGGLPGRDITIAFFTSALTSLTAAFIGWQVAHLLTHAAGGGHVAEALSIGLAVVVTYGLHLALAIRFRLISTGTIRVLLLRDAA